MMNLVTWQFWFTLSPGSLTPFAQKSFVGLLIFFVFLAALLFMAKRRSGLYRGFFKRLYTFSLVNALIGLILLFFDYELVPFFSARFWLALWGLVMLVWFVLILKKLSRIPAQKKLKEQDAELKKYLP